MKNNIHAESMDVIVVGQQPWDTEIGSNCKDVALEFSKKNRVLYVNYPLDRGTVFKNNNDPKIQKRLNIIKRKANAIEKIKENLWIFYPEVLLESINWINNETIYTFLNKLNGKRYAQRILHVANKLGFKNFILFNDNEIIRNFYLVDFLKPTVSIYYYRDYILGVPYWRKHGLILEPAIIKKNDLCLTNSYHFETYCRKYNSNSFYIGQGCDVEAFMRNDYEVPEDVKNINRPVIGYVGALQSLRLDLQVIEHIAISHPDWSIVLVGPEDDVFKTSVLHGVKNIHFLGYKDPSLMPAYVHAFDVCLNPQLTNEVTIGNYPRKVDEYLAAGKPVVATNTLLMQKVFSEYTYLANNKEEYVVLIEKTLHENNNQLVEKRKAFAATHSWENHVNEIYKAVNNYLQIAAP